MSVVGLMSTENNLTVCTMTIGGHGVLSADVLAAHAIARSGD